MYRSNRVPSPFKNEANDEPVTEKTKLGRASKNTQWMNPSEPASKTGPVGDQNKKRSQEAEGLVRDKDDRFRGINAAEKTSNKTIKTET